MKTGDYVAQFLCVKLCAEDGRGGQIAKENRQVPPLAWWRKAVLIDVGKERRALIEVSCTSRAKFGVERILEFAFWAPGFK